MAKLTFIGAGSFGFTRGLVRDILTFDPLTSAVLGIQEIKEMTGKMFVQNKDYLPQFSHFLI